MSSRASEITLLLIILQAAIGFVNATDLFSIDYMSSQQNQYVYTVSNLSDYNEITEEPGALDYLTSLAAWTWTSFLIGIKIVFAVLFIYPKLVDLFGIPEVLSGLLQIGIYYTYAIWYTQWKSGKGWKTYE